jgi:hypothetical protein
MSVEKAKTSSTGRSIIALASSLILLPPYVVTSYVNTSAHANPLPPDLACLQSQAFFNELTASFAGRNRITVVCSVTDQ